MLGGGRRQKTFLDKGEGDKQYFGEEGDAGDVGEYLGDDGDI